MTKIFNAAEPPEGELSEKLTDFRQLNVWKKAHALVLETYEVTKKFPKEEKGELASRMRQAAMDIPVYIAQGFMRRNPKEKAVPYKKTLESLEALKYYFILSEQLGYIREVPDTIEALEEVGRMLTGLVRSVKTESVKPQHRDYR
ncbi:four helix bundle protein [bacterium]|nr:four helix bundle protein [bacterium]